MKKHISILLSLFCITFPLFSQRGYVQNAIENHYENKYMNDDSSAFKKWTYGNLLNVKVDSSYSFPVSMHVHTTTYKKEKIYNETDMDVYINNSRKTMAMHTTESSSKSQNMYMIYDYTQNAMITLDIEKKTGIAMTMNAFMSKEMQNKLNDQRSGTGTGDNRCSKTGKSKIIQGYTCDEYICTDTEKGTRTVLWICSALLAQNIGGTLFGPTYGTYNFPATHGLAMEAYFYKNEVLEMKMEVSQINKSANYSIKTKTYAINAF